MTNFQCFVDMENGWEKKTLTVEYDDEAIILEEGPHNEFIDMCQWIFEHDSKVYAVEYYRYKEPRMYVLEGECERVRYDFYVDGDQVA